jgi:hypothetical protein
MAARENIPILRLKPLNLRQSAMRRFADLRWLTPPMMMPPHSAETGMAIDGKWEITINSPLGAQKATLDIKADGGTLNGTQTAMQGTQALTNGKVDGNNLTWSASITSPMPMTLEFSGAVDGDKLSGSVKAGAFGSFPFSGGRAA